MCSSMRQRFRAVVPKWFTMFVRLRKQEWRLRRVEIAEIGSVPLFSSRKFGVADVVDDSIRRTAEVASEEIGSVFASGDVRGATNPGDRCAIYSLVRRLQPKRVLEIGTHVGGSTLYIAKALDAQRTSPPFPRLVTVDIKDVNDSEARVWEQCGARASPREALAQLKCSDITEFVVSSSMDFLQRTTEGYDFIFLDGSHEADVVYQEIVGSLRILTCGGCILLHDYFPNGNALWRGAEAIPGPFLAVQRLRRDGVRVKAIPLGILPWKTKVEFECYESSSARQGRRRDRSGMSGR